MSTSHTGRNGLIEESQQTTIQRALFNNSMSPNGQRDNLSAIFPKSPIHMDDAERLAAFGAGGQDRAEYISTGDPYEDFKAYSIKDVTGGFGFENTSISMKYNTGKPVIDDKGIAEPERDVAVSDLFDEDEADVLRGHANLNVGPGFNSALHEKSTSTQVERNELVPGNEVDASSNRLDNISQYFNGAGNRSQNP